MHLAARQATNDGVSRASVPHPWPFRFPTAFPELRVLLGARQR
jgi:hypothetical protein